MLKYLHNILGLAICALALALAIAGHNSTLAMWVCATALWIIAEAVAKCR